MQHEPSRASPILIVPACEPGRGGGHLTRCMALASGLRALNREAWLLLPDGGARADELVNAAGFDRRWLINEKGLPSTPWGCIVLDRFQTPPEELARWSSLAPVIGIDEGGGYRDCFDFLIDILPGCHRSAANIADPSLLPLPEKREPPAMRNGAFRVLVSFGQEDAAGLGLAAARALADANNGGMDITLLRGGLASAAETQETANAPHIVRALPHLASHLADYDLVITHYGITAFEALYAGVPVLLISPSSLHEKLAQAAGFYSLGKAAASKLKRLLCGQGAVHLPFKERPFKERPFKEGPFLEGLKARCAALAAQYRLDRAPQRALAALVNDAAPDVSRACPACGAVLRRRALARYAERTYHRCARCGVIAMNRLTPPPITYDQEYFFELYQKQYGKTYIEDFPHLTAMARRRLAVIKRLLPRALDGSPRLLDIGCAYGPFLAAARDAGFSPYGIDPAPDAVRYVTETLGIPAVQGFFPRETGGGEPHVVTLWYVIEHFRDCAPVLAALRALLKPGGILAFATPSSRGISGRAAPRAFLERSPADHWTIWSPAAARAVMRASGFAVHKIINSGHHPERFPLLGAYARDARSPLYRLLLAISKALSLGDTFEVYAVRV